MSLSVEEIKKMSQRNTDEVQAIEKQHLKEVESVMFKSTEPTKRLTEASEEEKDFYLQEYEAGWREHRKEAFIEKYSRKIVRGNGSEIELTSNEFKLLLLAELFDYDVKMLEYLEYNAEDIINKTDTALLLLNIEQIKLLRRIINENYNSDKKEEANR